MRRSTWLMNALVVGGAMLLACSSSKTSGFDPNGNDPNNPNNQGVLGGGTSSSGGTPGAVCAPDPKNFDIPGNNCDDDNDGKVDNPPTCDASLSGGAADDIVKALGICDLASDKGYGLVSATLTQGNVAQAGILPKFGDVIKPREGGSLTVLSTGYGQEFDGTSGSTAFGLPGNGKQWKKNGTVPNGFPKAAAGCEELESGTNDVVQLTLKLTAPPNASGIKFDFNFYSSEWPAYVCSSFNDSFIAYLSAKGFNGGKADNVSFDSKNNPVSVNNGFFDRCTPNVEIGCDSDPLGGLGGGGGTSTSVCPGGPSELGGTGFGITGKWCKDTSTNGGATGWLTSQAPVTPGETFTIDFYIWDTGDQNLDSSVLLDNFTWAAGAVTPGTVRVN